MRVLFFSINNNWNPHFETELELMKNHINCGDEIYILTCGGKLNYCSSNPENRKHGCINCISRFREGIKLLNISNKNIFTLKNRKRIGLSKLIPDCFFSVSELKKFILFDVDFGMAVASSLISNFKDHNLNTVKNKKIIKKLLIESVFIYKNLLDFLDVKKPDIVYIFNGRFSDSRPVVRACEKIGISFYTHERGGGFTSYSLFKNSFPHYFDLQKKEILKLWNDELIINKEKISRKWFLDRANGKDQNWTSFVKYQRNNLLPDGFDKNKRNIIIYNSSIDEYSSISESTSFIYMNEIEAISRIVSFFKSYKEIVFYFRVHPNLKHLNNTQIKDLKKLEQKGFNNLRIIWPEEPISTYALLRCCEKVITFMSTVGVEACFWKKPSILLGRSVYEDLDCCYIPKTHEEVCSLLKSKLSSKPQINSLKYANWMLNKGSIFKFFQPSGYFCGDFLGKKIIPNLSIYSKIFLKFYWKYYFLKNKIKEKSGR